MKTNPMKTIFTILILFGMIFEDTWREMYRTEEIKDEE